ncbi:MAG: glycoside hydrolase [Anaerocolumna sp.]|jgi:beta-galactosidase|nr:glycoside hydrolase [Anaerocolumna sp.]
MGEKQLFHDNWEFTKQAIDCNIYDFIDDTKVWQHVDIPHDWVIYDTSSFYNSGEGWYRKSFYVDLINNKELDSSNGIKRNYYLLRFEGIYMDSTIYVNRTKVYEWKYGYSTFEVDITDSIIDGRNEILVRVVLKTPNSRWYSGGGIYRNVWLKVVPQVHLESDGIYIATEKIDSNWCVRVESEISNVRAQDEYILRYTIYDNREAIVCCVENTKTVQIMTVDSPKLWDIDSPYLYTLKTELLKNDVVIDEEINRFGFRTLRFEPDSGFYLNDHHVKLHGVCMHHDLGALGAAVNKAAIKRQMSILKEMGVNAIRTAHNMCAVEVLELADEMGILICSESFDMWEKPKTQYDYARFFKDFAEKDVKSWIRRDRNHPCIIMWCIGNEIYDTHVDERGLEVTQMLIDFVYRFDPCKNAPVTIGSNYMPWENARKCADIIKLVGYNYGEKYYYEHHKKYKDWIIYGSETGSIVQSRGIYHFPLSAEILSDDDEQCSSLGNSITSWGARSIEKCIINDRDANFSAGMFIWSGFDYIGEPTPYHTKNSYFGQIDTAGFKKDSFYIYQAEWTDYEKAPMVHIFPYWDFNEDQLIDVRVCSNAPKIELLFNNQSLGDFLIDHKHGNKLIGDWQIPYSKGELKAVAYDEYNHIIATDRMVSFFDPAVIKLKPDKTTLYADGRDFIFVEISMEDKFGNPVHNANNRVDVTITGEGRLIGLDNGDSTDYDSYKGTSRRLFSGKLLAIIAAKTTPGEILMEVSSTGLPSATLKMEALACDVPKGISAYTENRKSPKNSEIPIRKLEIISPQGNNLDSSLREVEVQVKIYPENATYADIEWRVTNASGVDSNIVTLTPNGLKAGLKALGDGTFYVRVSAKNGNKAFQLISAMDFNITGLGTAYYNPYEFISGSLFTKSIGEITSGNERGVATARDGESIVVFDKLDFGSYGSDEITLPVFELASIATQIEIWEGVPREVGSELLADVVYHKPSIWNTYQEETFQLKRRLSGVTSIAFLLRSKVHIKGFTFTKKEKAFEKLSILSYTKIYGDSYRIDEDAITNIGNNVTIIFDEMDFGIDGCKKLILCGSSNIENNTIHLCFNSDNGEIKQIVEFSHTIDYVEREFVLDAVFGLQIVSFIFLPGCNFNFKWFRFE